MEFMTGNLSRNLKFGAMPRIALAKLVDEVGATDIPI